MKTKNYRRRRRKPVLLWILVIAAILIGGWHWFQWQCWGVETTVTQVELSALPEAFDGLRIAHLSDNHGHEFGEDNSELLAVVAEQKPDIIMLTGDVIDQERQITMVPALAKGLTAIAPTYYVTGNHEWSLGSNTVRELKELLTKHGVTVLSNEYVVLEREGASIVLAGVDDPNGYADQKTPEELRAEITAQQPGLFTLLLAHRNDAFDRYAAAGYDLVLSGHGHGGIIRLPFTDGLVSPARTFFPTWTAGVYRLEDSTLFVSRGLGNNTVPISGFRLFNRPDLAILELKSTD